MKILFTLGILCASYFLLSQNIENKLGQNGNFIIKEAGDEDKTLFRFKKDFLGNSELVIARDPYVWPPSEDIWMLDVHSLTNNFPNISFASFGTINQGAVLHFQKANGNSPPGAVQADNILGSIYFTGYKDATSNFVNAAIIESKVTGMGTNGPSADITFSTSNGTIIPVRMTIKNNGDVVVENGGLVIASGDLDMVGSLFSTGTARYGGLGDPADGDQGNAYVIADDNGNLSRGASVSPNTPLIGQLQKENKELRDRLKKLEAIVEELASNK